MKYHKSSTNSCLFIRIEFMSYACLFFCRLPAGYCFIDFHDPENAHQAMLKLNGKNIPNSSPVSVFSRTSSDAELGHSQTKLTAKSLSD